MTRIRGSAAKVRAIVKLSPLLAFSSVSVYAVASVSEDRVVAAANYQQNIQAAVNIIPSTKLENEVVDPAEFVSLSTDKLLIDIATASEDIAIGVELATSDTVGAADAEVKESDKVAADSAVGVDALVQSVEKPLFSFANSSDDSSLDVTISKIETLVPVDTIDAFVVGKSLSDSATVFDALTAVQADKILEVFVVADAVKLRDVGKILFDSVSAPTDDATLLFGKNISDFAISADTIDTFVIGKSLADVGNTDDSAYAISISTPREDFVGTADLSTTTIGKVFADVSSAVDTISALSIGKGAADTGIADDSTYAISISTLHASIAMPTDVVASTIGKVFADNTAGVADVISKTVFRSVASSVGVVDVIARSVGLSVANTVVTVDDIDVTIDALNVIIDSNVSVGDSTPIIYNVRTQSDSFMFAGYELNGNQLN